MTKYRLKEVHNDRQQFISKSPSYLPHACSLKPSQYKCIMLFHSITEDKQDSVSSSSITWKIWLSLVTSTTSPICGRKMFPCTTPSFFLQCSARASVASVVPRTSIFKQKIHCGIKDVSFWPVWLNQIYWYCRIKLICGGQYMWIVKILLVSEDTILRVNGLLH